MVKDPSGATLSDWFYMPPGDIDENGVWSIVIRMTDETGQPTAEPFPSLGTYTVQVSCVSTYLPRVIKPYEELRFEVVAQLPPPTEVPAAEPVVAPVAAAATPVAATPRFAG